MRKSQSYKHYQLRITYYAFGLLLVRLVLLLFAARPSNPVVKAVLAVSAPLVWPFAAVDRWAQQPRFGARLELATLLALAVLVVLITTLAWGRREKYERTIE